MGPPLRCRVTVTDGATKGGAWGENPGCPCKNPHKACAGVQDGATAQKLELPQPWAQEVAPKSRMESSRHLV